MIAASFCTKLRNAPTQCHHQSFDQIAFSRGLKILFPFPHQHFSQDISHFLTLSASDSSFQSQPFRETSVSPLIRFFATLSRFNSIDFHHQDASPGDILLRQER
jgi:hypothetical protein